MSNKWDVLVVEPRSLASKCAAISLMQCVTQPRHVSTNLSYMPRLSSTLHVWDSSTLGHNIAGREDMCTFVPNPPAAAPHNTRTVLLVMLMDI